MGMTGELEAFTGHMLIVGGRAVRMPPPGFLVEAAPRRAARAREGDTFGVLVTPADDVRAPAAYFEGLARLATDTYFASGGGVTGGLREALLAVNAFIRGEGAEQAVNALAIVMRGNELYAARSGRIFGVVIQGEALTFLPDDRRDPLALELPALGVESEPPVQLARYTITAGHAVLLADTGLLEADDDALAAALTVGNLRDAVDQLKALAGPEASAALIRFVPPGTADPAEFEPAASSHAARSTPPSEESAAPAPSPEPPAKPAAPADPASALPPFMEAATGVPAGDLGDLSALEDAEPQDADDDLGDLEDLDDDEILTAARPMTPLTPRKAWPRPAAEPAAPSPAAPAQTPAPGEESGEPSGLVRAREALGKVTGTAATVTRRARRESPAAFQQATYRVQRVGRDVVRAILVGLLAVTSFLGRILDQVLPEPSEDRPGLPTNIAIGAAILVPVVIVVVVVGVSLARDEQSEFEIYLDQARTLHEETLALSGGTCDNSIPRDKWADVLYLADQAGKYRPKDANVLRIRADAQNFLDNCYDKIARRHVTELYEYEDNADLVGPIVHTYDMYVLDRANDLVYYHTLNETGDGLIGSTEIPIGSTAQRQQIDGYPFGDLIDIAWVRSGGTRFDNVIVALNTDGVLFAYSPLYAGHALKLETDRWSQIGPVAIEVFNENGGLYVLDPGANQIWRYIAPAGGEYSSAPEAYFSTDFVPDLSGAVDLGITETGSQRATGSIFVLFADGSVQKFYGGLPEDRNEDGIADFSFRQRPDNAIHSGQSLYVDNDPASLRLYLVDPSDAAIYATSWAGIFEIGYRARQDEELFASATGVYAAEVESNNMYVVANHRLYHFWRNE